MAGRWWLVPGTLCTSEVFKPVLDALAISSRACRTVRIDRPTVDDYAAEFAEVSEEDVVLGFSLGSVLAAHHVDRIRARAVILFSANPFADVQEKRAARLNLLANVLVDGATATLSATWPGMVGRAASTNSGIKTQIERMGEETAADIVAQTMLALSRPGAGPMLAASISPLLFLTGREDEVAPPARAELAASIGAHNLTLIDNAGHFLPLEAPRACANAVSRFLTNEESAPC